RELTVVEIGSHVETNRCIPVMQSSIARGESLPRGLYVGGERIPMNLAFGRTPGRRHNGIEILDLEIPHERRICQFSRSRAVEGSVPVQNDRKTLRVSQ